MHNGRRTLHHESNDSAVPAHHRSGGERDASLDPARWDELRAQGHRMLDDMFDYLEHIRERPVWQPAPDAVRASLREPIPLEPTPLEVLHETFMRDILPHAVGNAHPRFMGWVHGGGTPVGMLAEMLAAGLNANVGGRDQIPVEVERQIAEWARALFGFPEGASGLFVTGSSIANLVGVVVARTRALGAPARRRGVHDASLVAYTSASAHLSVARAMDIAGIGTDALRAIPTDEQFRMQPDALEAAIAQDRAEGLTPFLVVATAGTADVGAVDELAEIGEIARRERLWFHVDGAYGALAALSPALAPLLRGIDRADSIAFDFHKWGQVPYDAGFILVRDGELHRAAFAGAEPSYLARDERALSGGSPWPCDLGPDLSRGFRALKTWFTIKAYGARRLGESIERSCALASLLAARVAAEPELELLAPVTLNVVCFRYRPRGWIRLARAGGANGGRTHGGVADPARAERQRRRLNELNAAIVAALQSSGVVAPSSTLVRGQLAIRAALVNHRTTSSDVEALIGAALTLGRALERDYVPAGSGEAGSGAAVQREA